MPKHLAEFSLSDYLHLRPVTQGLKTRRYRRMDARYMALPAAVGDEAAIRAAVRGQKVLLTVAFNDPDCLDMHAALVGKFVARDRHLVIDNSTDEDAARQNRLLCAAHDVLYLRLPDNPWTRRNESRSHGMALNWAWHNIFKPGEPEAFGFLDHDLFPIRPTDPFGPLDRHAFYGDLRWAGERWYLWAGFSFFRFDAIRAKPVDFGLDWFVGLDTGGANWDVLYRHTDPQALPQRPVEPAAILPGVPLQEAKIELRGDWIHEVGWGTNPAYRAAKRAALKARLEPLLPSRRPDDRSH
jgi:hypothetical protein